MEACLLWFLPEGEEIERSRASEEADLSMARARWSLGELSEVVSWSL